MASPADSADDASRLDSRWWRCATSNPAPVADSPAMPLSEILRIAFTSIGVNKLRSSLTMLGITIGVFSVIGVMTTVSALRSSIETGLSFLGTNFFQFGKYPTGLSGGSNRRQIEMRRDITLAQAMRFQQLLPALLQLVNASQDGRRGQQPGPARYPAVCPGCCGSGGGASLPRFSFGTLPDKV